ncbi:phage replisome organizer N-terminal domain-containing protein [Gudongella sp. SC589]|uniref:phage replisome organizer N-terminal domain-containing protein n=1 Tax=Gudongella sp. SC589 TaxID=3385990 RepID=UPI00390491CD
MSDVKWIKITTNMFEDEKIDFIESLPESDAILVIWIKLLTLAGKANANGFIFLTEQIPYTDEMLSHKFRRPLSTVKLALNTFKKLEMIDYTNDGFLRLTNWDKHQNIEGLEKIRTQNRIRKQRQREKEKLEILEGGHVTSRDSHATEEELEEELELDKEEDITSKVVDFYKDMLPDLPQPRKMTNKRKKHIKARINEYGFDEVIVALQKIRDSDFLQGRNDRDWKPDIDWIFNVNNFVKVLEGKYDNRKGGENGFAGNNSTKDDAKDTPWGDLSHIYYSEN